VIVGGGETVVLLLFLIGHTDDDLEEVYKLHPDPADSISRSARALLWNDRAVRAMKKHIHAMLPSYCANLAWAQA
jgi:hypothetical protein